ncbi:MAG: hypothetical protein KDK65_01750 [Chlamydiia bacterium]|nr:hypothetical protein [Chlamydiia bacterium]
MGNNPSLTWPERGILLLFAAFVGWLLGTSTLMSSTSLSDEGNEVSLVTVKIPNHGTYHVRQGTTVKHFLEQLGYTTACEKKILRPRVLRPHRLAIHSYSR